MGAVIALFATGCGGGTDKGAPTHGVSGEVTFNGEPVPEGEITFMAADGAAQSAPITNGKYRVQATAGKKTVQVQGRKIIPGGRKGAKGEPIPQEYIPDHYGQRSNLTADVTAGGPNRFDFKLEGK